MTRRLRILGCVAVLAGGFTWFVPDGALAAGEAPAAPVLADGDPDREAIAERVRQAGEAARRMEAESGDDAAGAAASGPDDMASETPGGAGPKTPDDRGPWKRSRPPMPYEIVRSLQFLQDQVARGNAAAIRVQARLLRRFGPTFLAADPVVWEDRRNLRAAALFVLSGGPPSVLRGILARASLAETDELLLEGALAYVENRTDLAQSKLSSLDLDAMEPGLAAQISLALAQMMQLGDPKAALVHLSRARLLAPGGLVEEAALRMGVLLAEETGDRAAADHLARQYFHRYPNSAYSGNFRARFAAAYADRPAGTEAATIATIEDAVEPLDEAEKLAIYLAVGRRALVTGNIQLADEAARRAIAIEAASPEDRQRALLYAVASTLPEKSFAEATATLNALDPELLHPADLRLRDAAYSVLSQMRKPLPEIAEGEPEPAEGGAASAIIERGKELLNEVSNDLKETSR